MGTGVNLDMCEPIGRHGLVGKVDGELVTIGGPCGAGHVMSIAAARDLRTWLETNLPASATVNQS